MKTIRWSAPEYEHKKRTADWYWAVGIIAVAIAVASVILGNPLFGLLILLALFALTLYSYRPPETVDIEASEIGVRANKNFFPHQNTESFWIEETGRQKKLFLKSKKLVMPLIALPIAPDINTAELRTLLLGKLTEEPLRESFLEQVLERLGF